MRELHEWKGVFVTESGRIFGTKSNGERFEYSLWTDRYGYKNITLKRTASGVKRRKNLKVHRIVHELYVGPLIDGLVVCHLNGIPDDNRFENLLQATQKINHSHKKMHGTQPRGEASSSCTVADETIDEVVTALRDAKRDTIGRLARREVSRIATEIGVSERFIRRASIAFGRDPDSHGVSRDALRNDPQQNAR